MRMIEIDQYDESTMSIALPLLDDTGKVIAAPFSKLHPHSKKEVKQLGIEVLAVNDIDSIGIALDDMVEISPWMDTIEIVKRAFQAAADGRKLPIADIFRGAEHVIEMVEARPYGIPLPLSMIPTSLKMYAHAVNVAFVSVQIGLKLAFNKLQLQDLAVGCLLHDIGKAVTKEVAKHAEEGFELLGKYKEINLLSAQIAYQHHESIEGSGYPRKLKGTEILELAQVCAVANLQDHLLSINRIARREAQEIILALKGMLFTERVVHAFEGAVPSYIPGTKVCIHQGEAAIVSRLSENIHRPVIRYIRTGEEVDLSAHPNLWFTEIDE